MKSLVRNFFPNKNGTILIENVIFIILNIVFISIIIIFLARQSSGAFVLEENYAKQIALIVDYSKPEMLIKINMEKGIKIAEKNNYNPDDVVKISENIVYVKLREEGGYSYSFFNDVDASAYYDSNGIYIITINEKNKENDNE